MLHNEDGEPSTLSERITELSRKVSVEAGVGPIALYASRSRSASNSSATRPSNVQFSEPADSERAKTRTLSRCAEKPTLPRIDSEKTLAPVFADDDEDDEQRPKEPASPSLEIKPTRTATRASEVTAQSEKSRSPVDDDQRTIEEIEEEIVAKMSKTRKILLGFVMMMNVFIAVSSPFSSSKPPH